MGGAVSAVKKAVAPVAAEVRKVAKPVARVVRTNITSPLSREVGSALEEIPGSREAALEAGRIAALAAAAYASGGLAGSAGLVGQTGIAGAAGTAASAATYAAAYRGANVISKATGGTGNVLLDTAKGFGYTPRGEDQPAAPTPEAAPSIDPEAIARARRLAALRGQGGGRQGTFLGGASLGNG